MMCFGALIRRSIGMKKPQREDNILSQNSVTSNEFFARHPELRSFLLEQLKIATSQVSPFLKNQL